MHGGRTVFVYFTASSGDRAAIERRLASLVASGQAAGTHARIGRRTHDDEGGRDTWLEQYELQDGTDPVAWLRTIGQQAARLGLAPPFTGERHVEVFDWVSRQPCA